MPNMDRHPLCTRLVVYPPDADPPVLGLLAEQAGTCGANKRRRRQPRHRLLRRAAPLLAGWRLGRQRRPLRCAALRLLCSLLDL